MRTQGLSRTHGTRGTKETPGTDGTQGNTRGTIFHWFGRHAPTIPKREYNSSGKFTAVCRRVPISVDANSAECKPKYGRSPKFNSRSAGHADSRPNQVGREPIYDGEDLDQFKPWLTQLENACIVGKRDVREVAICSCAGPVLEVISSTDPTEPWSVHRDELRRWFSPNKTRVHAANLLNNFCPQHATENL